MTKDIQSTVRLIKQKQGYLLEVSDQFGTNQLAITVYELMAISWAINKEIESLRTKAVDETVAGKQEKHRAMKVHCLSPSPPTIKSYKLKRKYETNKTTSVRENRGT